MIKKINTLIAVVCLCGSLFSQTVTPTQTDNITNDNGNNQADPGETIRYKLDISNSGSDANGVQLNAVPDAKTTLVPGSFRSSPLAMPDSYACTGNVGITVPAGSGLLVNDFDDDIAGLTITAAAGATTEGGAFAIASDGSFSYQPPAGFTGSDEFTYMLEDGNELPDCPPTDEGTVTITVSNLIWFVDNTGGGMGGDGRLNTPFKTLADFNANSTPVGDVTYIEHTGTDYTGGIVLQNNERLFGEGHTGGANLADVLGFSLAPFSNSLPDINGSRPVITNNSGDGVQLASGNTLRGFNVGNCSDFGIDDNGAVGSLTISEVDISNSTGGGFRTDNGGTLAVTLDGVSSTGGVNGVDLNNCSGTFTVSGTTSITNSTNTAANISNNNATVSFNVLNITNTSSNETGLFASGGTVNSTSGAINTGSGRAVDMDNVALGMTLTSVSCDGATTGIDLNTTTGGFSVSGDSATSGSGGVITNCNSDNVLLNDADGVALNWMTISNSRDHEIHIVSASNFNLVNSVVSDNTNLAGAAGDDEHGVFIENIFGTTNIIEDVSFQQINENGIYLNTTTTDDGAQDILTIRRCSFTDHQNQHGENGIALEPDGNSNLKVIVDDNDFTIDADGAIGLLANTLGNAQFEGEFKNNTFNCGLSFGSGGIQTIVATSSVADLKIMDNDVNNANFNAILCNVDDDAILNATISGNTIDGTVCGGCTNRLDQGISGRVDENPKGVYLIEDNTISNSGFEGIYVVARDKTGAGTLPPSDQGRLVARILNNDVLTVPSNEFAHAINVLAQDDNPVCAKIEGNNTAGGDDGGFPGFGEGVHVSGNSSVSTSLEVGSASLGDPPTTVLQTNNSAGTSWSTSGSITVVSNGSCQ